jgi:hypothetical protein
MLATMSSPSTSIAQVDGSGTGVATTVTVPSAAMCRLLRS